MKRIIVLFIIYVLFLSMPGLAWAGNHNRSESGLILAATAGRAGETVQQANAHSSKETGVIHEDEGERVDRGHHEPAGWSVIPFILLLLLIAGSPLYEHFWHHNYPKVAISLAIIVVAYYIFWLGNVHSPVHSAFEYFQFIALLTGLFVASGGIVIDVDKKATPGLNAAMLLIGAVVANIIGTTGASMLLIRPFIRVNKHRIKAYHIIFFIFIISNVGGSLTPIGDPPLFLGFLKGVPFFWTLVHNFFPWAFGVLMLVIVFYFVDKRNKTGLEGPVNENISDKATIKGTKSFIWLLIIILSVFLDPNVFDWVPAIHYDGARLSFLRELIMLTVAYLSYKTANKDNLKANEFNFEPIREVALIFIGIFGTMMPALELVGLFAQSDVGSTLVNHNTLYWGTGMLSGFLDNAPTYLNFLAAGMASVGADMGTVADVTKFANGGFPDSLIMLKAISIGAVFFGAFSYIGNGPNFMVKSIAEQVGIDMPSFFGYIIKYSLTILLPLYLLVWLIFFAFA